LGNSAVLEDLGRIGDQSQLRSGGAGPYRRHGAGFDLATTDNPVLGVNGVVLATSLVDAPPWLRTLFLCVTCPLVALPNEGSRTKARSSITIRHALLTQHCAVPTA